MFKNEVINKLLIEYTNDMKVFQGTKTIQEEMFVHYIRKQFI